MEETNSSSQRRLFVGVKIPAPPALCDALATLQTHAYKSSDHTHIDKHYIPYDWAQSVAALDGLIVTGAPVEELPWEEITYWKELVRIFDVARKSNTSILGICWGGLALAKYIGFEKIVYPQKIFGVYPTRNLVPDHPIMGGLDDVFWCPRSLLA